MQNAHFISHRVLASVQRVLWCCNAYLYPYKLLTICDTVSYCRLVKLNYKDYNKLAYFPYNLHEYINFQEYLEISKNFENYFFINVTKQIF